MGYRKLEVKTLTATSMLLEAIGEGIKKVDRRTDGELFKLCPNIPWEDIIGMRDHIAHGYFNIDADIVFDVVKNDILPLKDAVSDLLGLLD